LEVKMLKPLLIAAAMAAGASPAAARTNDFAQYDVSRAATLGEQLVMCDRAKLLSNPPSRDALRAYVRVDNSRFDLALPPDFTRPSGWYDYDLEQAYDRLRGRGLVNREDVRAARARYEVPLLSRAERPSVSERRFLRAQSSHCRRIIQDASRR
jgi:hypothetical protein